MGDILNRGLHEETHAVSKDIICLGRVVDNPYRHIESKMFMQYPEDPIAAELGVHTSEYFCPSTGPGPELESLLAQHQDLEEVVPPSEQVSQRIIELVANTYPHSRDPWPNLLNPQYWVNTILPHLNHKAGTGWPMAQQAVLVGEVANTKYLLDFVVSLAVQRLQHLSQLSPLVLESKIKEDPLYAVRSNLADVHRVFVKNEPHNKRKVMSKSWRLINVCSVVDNLVDRFLFTEQDTLELQNWHDLPSKCGAGLTDEDGEILAQYVARFGLNLETDMTGWDIRVPYYLLKMEVEARIRLNNACMAWTTAARNVTILAAHRVIMTSSGDLYVRSVPGGQSSGRKITSSGNSRMRFMLAALVANDFKYTPRAMCQGDDCVEYLPEDIPEEDYKASVKRWGPKLKMAQRCSAERFGFCSQTFTCGGRVITPESPAKMVSKFLFGTALQVADEAFESLRVNLRHGNFQKLLDYCGSVLAHRRQLSVKEGGRRAIDGQVWEA